MQRHLSLTVFCGVLAALLLPGRLSATDWEAIRAAQARSVVYIYAKAIRSNGFIEPSTGTGVIVEASGYVLTCNHVIPEKTEAFASVEVKAVVGARAGTELPLTVIFRDPQADLALVKLPQIDQPWIPIKTIDSAPLRLQSEILAVGFPLDLPNMVAVPGAITSLDADGRWLTNAGLNHGMSGGPVFNQAGSLVALVSGGHEEGQLLNLIEPISFASALLGRIPGRPVPNSNHPGLAAVVTAMAKLRKWAQDGDTLPRLTQDVVQTRADFLEGWKQATVPERLALPPTEVRDAFLTEILLRRDAEANSDSFTTSHEMANAMIVFFHSKQELAPFLVQAYIADATVYYDQIQCQPWDLTKRAGILQGGLSVLHSALETFYPLTADQQETLGKSAQGQLFRLNSSFHYEKAKPQGTDFMAWDVSELRLAYDSAVTSSDYAEPQAVVPRIRCLRQLAIRDLDTYASSVKDELRRHVVNTSLKMLDPKISPADAIPILNNLAMLIHEVVLTEVTGKTALVMPALKESDYHETYAVPFQERVAALADEWPSAHARKGDFEMDLARVYALQAKLHSAPTEEPAQKSYLAKMDRALEWIANDQSLTLAGRSGFADQALQSPEFADFQTRPSLQALRKFASVASRATTPKTRLLLEVFPPATAGPLDPDFFEKLLREKVKLLSQAETGRLANVEKLTVQGNNAPFPKNAQELAAHWAASTTVLEILSGAILQLGEAITTASNIDLDQRHGALKKSILGISIKVTPAEFLSFKDLYCGITLYAMAMDAKALGQPPATILKYLTESQLLLGSTSATQNGTSVETRNELLVAIQKESDAIKPR